MVEGGRSTVVQNNFLQTCVHESVDLSDLLYVFFIPCPVDMCFVN